MVQIGNTEDTHCGTEEAEIATDILEDYYRDFQIRNPNLYVFSAHLHLDESTPHLHIDFVPFTTHSKRGLETRVSLKQALADQGFRGTSKGDTEWVRWAKAEKRELARIMEMYDVKWYQKDTHNEHLSVLDYKKEKRAEEVERLDEIIAEKKVEVETLEYRVKNYKENTERLETLENKLSADPEYQLPDVPTLMTAKAYRSKFIEPLFTKLKKLIFSLIAECTKAWDSYYRLNDKNGNLHNDILRLRDKIKGLTTENERLRDENREYSFLKRYLGQPLINKLKDRAVRNKQIEEQKQVRPTVRNKSRDRDER